MQTQNKCPSVNTTTEAVRNDFSPDMTEKKSIPSLLSRPPSTTVLLLSKALSFSLTCVACRSWRGPAMSSIGPPSTAQVYAFEVWSRPSMLLGLLEEALSCAGSCHARQGGKGEVWARMREVEVPAGARTTTWRLASIGRVWLRAPLVPVPHACAVRIEHRDIFFFAFSPNGHLLGVWALH